MKKAAMVLVLCFCTFIECMSQGREVTLVNDDPTAKRGQHKFEVPPIKVEDGDDEVTITSDSTQTIGVVIRGTDGTLMYEGVVNATKMGTSIYVPTATFTDKFTIDIYTDDRHLKGIF